MLQNGTCITGSDARYILQKKGLLSKFDNNLLVIFEDILNKFLLEGVGVEYLLLCLIPQDLAKRHSVLPERLLDLALKSISDDNKDKVFHEQGLQPLFVEQLGFFVQATSNTDFFLERLQYAEPGLECRAGILRISVTLDQNIPLSRYLKCIKSKLDELEVLQYTNDNTVCVSVAMKMDDDTARLQNDNALLLCRFMMPKRSYRMSFHIIGTHHAHYIVTCALRKMAYMEMKNPLQQENRLVNAYVLATHSAWDEMYEPMRRVNNGGLRIISDESSDGNYQDIHLFELKAENSRCEITEVTHGIHHSAGRLTTNDNPQDTMLPILCYTRNLNPVIEDHYKSTMEWE